MDRGPRSEDIFQFNAPFNKYYCFRISRSLLWPVQWNSRLMFIIIPPLFRLRDLSKTYGIVILEKLRPAVHGLDCEQSLFSQPSLSSAGLERAKWLRGKLASFPASSPASLWLLVFCHFARFPRSHDHPKGLLAVYAWV